MLNHKLQRIMAGISMIVCVCIVTGCSGKKEENIISSELVSGESGFGQDTAQIGDFVESKTFDAKRIYPISNVITSQYEGVILEKINVQSGQNVKKGELLVSIEPITDELIAEKEAAIAKNKEDVDAVLTSYQATMNNLQNSIGASSGTQQKLYQVQLEKTQKQYEWYQKSGNRDQEEMKAELEYLRSLQGDLNIYAPYDGVIDTVSNVQTGTELDSSRELLTMHSEEQIMLEVGEGSSLRFGQIVTVETGSGDNIKSYKGTVISANNVRSDALKTGSAVIRLDDQVPAEELGNVRIKANIKELYNVLVIKNYAVSTEKDKNYVSILKDDQIMKRRVISGGNCGEYTWILQGVSEGQTVTIQ